MFFVLLVCLYCLSYKILTIQGAELGIGDVCILTCENRGRCEKISECPYALNLLKNKQDLVTCGFLGLEPIVYCTEPPTKPNPSAPTRREPGDISRKECERLHPKVPASLRTSENSSLVTEYQHMSTIGYESGNRIHWLCEGFLISEHFVLTEAGCFDSTIFGSPKWVRVGNEARRQNFTAKRLIAHPDYKPPIKYHNIGLIELDRKAKLDVFVHTACLHTDRQLQYSNLVETSWGKFRFSAERNSSLLKANLDYVPHDTCRQYYSNPAQLPNGIDQNMQICAGKPDIGCVVGIGPLQALDINRTDFDRITYHIVGIPTLGKVCANTSVFTRVAYYVPWIESIVWPNVTL